MTKSDNIDLLATALSKAQAELSPAKKDAKNPFFESDYATLESVWEAARGPLTKNNLSIVQATEENAGIVLLKTILLHSSGQWIESTYPVIPVKQDPQSLGSALTYARRYGFASMVGIVQTDDDANAASGKTAPNPGPKTHEKINSKPIAPSQAAGPDVVPFDSRDAVKAPGERILGIGKLGAYSFNEIITMKSGKTLLQWAKGELEANRKIQQPYQDLVEYAFSQGAI